MLKMVDKEYIRKLHYVKGWPIRKISRELGHARQTIRKMLVDAELPRYQRSSPRPSPVMDPYRKVIEQWLDDDRKAPTKQRHTAKRIYDRLAEEYGFSGAESTVRRFVAQLRAKPKEVFIPLSAAWGEQAQADWARVKVRINGVLTEVSLFCLRMKASRVAFAQAYPTEKIEALLAGHCAGFEWLGGVPGQLVFDNPKTVVVKVLAGPEREEHARYSSLRAHYLFDSLFCNPGKGHEKGSVENLVGYIRRNALVPVPDVPDLETLNKRLLAWCERERNRHREAWEQERAGLRELPPHPFRCSVTKLARVNKLSLVTYDRVRYSVPSALVGQTVRIEALADRVEIWHDEECLAVHERCYQRGEMVLRLEHYLDALERKPRAVTHAAVVRELPAVYQEVRKRLCAARLDGYREFCQVLLLHREFPSDLMKHALETAVAQGSVGFTTIRQLLLNRLSPVRPEPVPVPTALAGYQVPAPDAGCYDALLEVACTNDCD